MSLRVVRPLVIGLAAVILSVWDAGAQAPSRPAGRAGVPAVVARALPAVVSITTRQIERDQFNQPVPTRGLGSGFIVDRRGHILTNYHVVEGAEQIKVTLPDERAFRATLVGADRFTDLAVLKIEAKDLPVLPLGDSSRLAAGEAVIAIGSPLWIEGGPTVTVGVVSALGRSMEEPGLPILHDLIQTDAAINPGNSGGPLLNLAGQVVGINTAVIRSAHGIGFAISVNSARPVLRALLETGRVARRSLGVTAVSVTPQVAYVNDLPIERGALVVRVDPGGPGEAAGLQPGDVIRSVAGEVVKDLHHFHESLNRRKAGEVAEVTVWREGETLTLRPVVGEEQ
jgi:S1-C subfamily serine protease